MDKKKPKKLILNAETLRNLSEPQLHQALGGVSTNDCSATHICSNCRPCL